MYILPKTGNIDREIDHHLDPDSKRQPRILVRARPKQDRAGTLVLAAESDIIHPTQAAPARVFTHKLRKCNSGVCEQKHSSGKADPWEDKPSERQIRGRRAVSASGLQGRGSPKRSVVFTDTGMILKV